MGLSSWTNCLSVVLLAGDLVSFSVSNEENIGFFDSLDQAFKQTAALEEAELVLLPVFFFFFFTRTQ